MSRTFSAQNRQTLRRTGYGARRRESGRRAADGALDEADGAAGAAAADSADADGALDSAAIRTEPPQYLRRRTAPPTPRRPRRTRSSQGSARAALPLPA